MFVLTVVAAVNGAVLAWAGSMSTQVRGPLFWSLASFSLSLAAASIFIVPDPSSPLRPLLFNLSAVLSHGLWLAGTLRFCQRPARDSWVFGVVAASMLLTAWFTLFDPSRDLRVFFSAGSAVALRAAAAWTLWRYCSEHGRWVARIAAAVAMTETLFLLDHSLAALQGLVPGIGFDPQASRQLTWIAMLLTAVVSTPLLMLLGLSRLLGELQRSAYHDSLTGLLNRRGFFSQTVPLIAHGKRSQQPAAVLMFDVDHFKTLNDRYGHAVGDQVLQAMATTLSEVLRSADVSVRWGGEEFCALLLGADGAGAHLTAERARRRFAELCRSIPALSARRVSVSIGIAYGSLHKLDFETLQKNADNALYSAKSAGRDRVEALDEPAADSPSAQPSKS